MSADGGHGFGMIDGASRSVRSSVRIDSRRPGESGRTRGSLRGCLCAHLSVHIILGVVGLFPCSWVVCVWDSRPAQGRLSSAGSLSHPAVGRGQDLAHSQPGGVRYWSSDGQGRCTAARWPISRPTPATTSDKPDVDEVILLVWSFRSDGDDLDEAFESGEVVGVAGVEPGSVGVGGGCDQQVHCSAAGLASGIDHCGVEASVADRDRVVDGEGVEVLLHDAESTQSLGPHGRGLGDSTPNWSSARPIALIARSQQPPTLQRSPERRWTDASGAQMSPGVSSNSPMTSGGKVEYRNIGMTAASNESRLPVRQVASEIIRTDCGCRGARPLRGTY